MTLPLVKGTLHSDLSIVATQASLIEAFSGSDSIIGSSGADQIYGGHSQWEEYGLNEDYIGTTYKSVGDNDTIDAGAGNDVIYVGTGTDKIDGGAGIDQLDFFSDGTGQFEKDTIPAGQLGKHQWITTFGELTDVSVDLLAGTYSGTYEDSAHKVAGHNSGTFTGIEAVLGTAGNDTMRGSNHNDQFKPYGGTDVIDGRGGFDILSYNDAGTHGITVTWSSGTAVDTYGHSDHFSNIEEIVGSRFADTFNGTTGSQVFVGGDGADIFNGAAGVDTVDYSLETGSAGINVTLGNGTGKDTYGKIDHLEGIEDIKASAHADVITGDITNNTFWGNAGNDNIGGLAGNDTLWGGDGKDTLSGGDNNDTLYGDADNDNLYGGNGTDSLSGGDNNDALKGGAGNDTIHGDAGNDNLDGQTGDDLLYGDDGNDTLSDNQVLSWPDFYNGIASNTLHGGDGDDTLTGVGMLYGDAGADHLSGVGTLNGGDGDDTLTAERPDIGVQPAMAYLIGGAGNDTLIENETQHAAIADYSYVKHGLTVALGQGKVVVGAGDTDTLEHITAIRDTDYADVITGTDAAETIEGGDGNNLLKGGAGDDDIDGGAGKDTIFGGDGDDYIRGLDGNDVLHTGSGDAASDPVGYYKGAVSGGIGNDTIYVEGGGNAIHRLLVKGDAGADTIIVSGGNSELNGDTGVDRFVFKAQPSTSLIRDFDVGEKIDLSAFHFANFAALHADIKYLENGGAVLHLPDAVEITIGSFAVANFTQGDFIL